MRFAVRGVNIRPDTSITSAMWRYRLAASDERMNIRQNSGSLWDSIISYSCFAVSAHPGERQDERSR